MATEVDRERINALLRELRAGEPGDIAPSVHDLARRHQLDPMVVRRIAESEDVDLEDGDAVPEAVDEEAPTGPIDVD